MCVGAEAKLNLGQFSVGANTPALINTPQHHHPLEVILMSAYFAKNVLTTVALFSSLTTATSVFAHAHLKSETPAAGSTVTAPKELRLVFSEGVEASPLNKPHERQDTVSPLR